MVDTKRVVDLAARIAEAQKNADSIQDHVRFLADELLTVLSGGTPPKMFAWVDRFPRLVPQQTARGRAGDAPSRVLSVLAAGPSIYWKPRELAEKLGMTGTQARSLGITLLRMRKEGRVRFHENGKVYSHKAA